MTVFQGEIRSGSLRGDAFLNQGGELVIQGLEVNGANIPSDSSLIEATGNSASVFIDPAEPGSDGLAVRDGRIGVSVLDSRDLVQNHC